MAEVQSASSASAQGQREITLKQIKEQKAFVREYCQQFVSKDNNTEAQNTYEGTV